MAMLGITNHSKVPLRLATMAGFAISVLSLLVAFGYLVAKLLFWDQLQLGLAPLLIGIYFFGAVQLFFIGVLGEYIGAIHTQVHKRPAGRGEGADQLRRTETASNPAPAAGARGLGGAGAQDLHRRGSHLMIDEGDGGTGPRVVHGSAK